MKRIHIALGVRDISKSVREYSRRLGKKPDTVIPNEYALWRTPSLNFSIRLDPKNAGKLRHLGWEDGSAQKFSRDKDSNGIVWERFSRKHQADEIEALWPTARRRPRKK